ncbi:MAG: Holliday junction resolvase RuvX [Minisyncoccota bacterium]
MRYLGIDFGTKKVGLALSDERGVLAFPEAVIKNDRALLPSVVALCAERGVGEIVMGDSRDFAGEENTVHAPASAFAKALAGAAGVPVSFEPEFLTSYQARQFQGSHAMIDASAAAIILQSFLDRKSTRSILDDDE